MKLKLRDDEKIMLEAIGIALFGFLAGMSVLILIAWIVNFWR
jgi:hypothetical protein